MNIEAQSIIDITKGLDSRLNALNDELKDYKLLCKTQERSLILLGIFPNIEKPTSLEAIREARSDILHMCDYIRASVTDSPISGDICSRALLAQERLRERLARDGNTCYQCGRQVLDGSNMYEITIKPGKVANICESCQSRDYKKGV